MGSVGSVCVALQISWGMRALSPSAASDCFFRYMSQFVVTGTSRSGLLEGPEQRMSWPPSSFQNKTLLWGAGKGVTAFGHVASANQHELIGAG